MFLISKKNAIVFLLLGCFANHVSFAASLKKRAPEKQRDEKIEQSSFLNKLAFFGLGTLAVGGLGAGFYYGNETAKQGFGGLILATIGGCIGYFRGYRVGSNSAYAEDERYVSIQSNEMSKLQQDIRYFAQIAVGLEHTEAEIRSTNLQYFKDAREQFKSMFARELFHNTQDVNLSVPYPRYEE